MDNIFKIVLENRQAIVNEARTMKSKQASAFLTKFGFSKSERQGILSR